MASNLFWGHQLFCAVPKPGLCITVNLFFFFNIPDYVTFLSPRTTTGSSLLYVCFIYSKTEM